MIKVLCTFDDAQPYLRGTIAGLGFKQVDIEYERAARMHGEIKFPFSKLISLALDGILNHSTVPLRISTFFGLVVSALTLAGLLGYVAAKLIFGLSWPVGFATLAALILGSISINAMLLGMIGEYLGRMYRQMRRRPLTIVESVFEQGRLLKRDDGAILQTDWCDHRLHAPVRGNLAQGKSMPSTNASTAGRAAVPGPL